MRAVIFVHPGYLARTDVPLEGLALFEAFRNNTIYGSYAQYRNNLARLYETTKDPTVFIMERQGNRLNPYHQGFTPKDDSLVFESTPDGIFTLSKNGNKWKRREYSPTFHLPRILKSKGIDEAIFSGESGPYEGHHQACVGLTYFFVSQEIKSRGAKGCIYPIIPYRRHISEEFISQMREMEKREKIDMGLESFVENQTRLLRELYDEAVELVYFSNSLANCNKVPSFK